jgi:hypothetical protein
MDVNFDESVIIRVKLTNDDLQDLASGENILINLNDTMLLQIYHSPHMDYESKCHLNGEDPE